MVIKRTWVPTAAGASVRSLFEEKTSVMFGMVRGRAPLCYAKQEEGMEIKSSAERGI